MFITLNVKMFPMYIYLCENLSSWYSNYAQFILCQLYLNEEMQNYFLFPFNSIQFRLHTRNPLYKLPAVSFPSKLAK